MKKICICGHFGFGLNLLNGQTVKTKILTDELTRRYGADDIMLIDTHGKKNLILMFFRLIWALAICRNVIIMPAYGGVKIVPLWLRLWNFLFHRKLHYSVIGGWLAGYVDRYKTLKWALKSYTGIYVETTTMQKALMERGLNNTVVVPNCKPLDILNKDEIICLEELPLRLVTFSRVMEKKGIGDIARIVQEINREKGVMVYQLDIYGQVFRGEEEWFEELQSTFDEAVRYKGVVEYNDSVSVLKQYFAMVFPTHFFTEGIPGTVIDAYASALPVISAKWESFSDIVDDGKTGLGYEFDNLDALKNLLEDIALHPEIVNNMREACIKKAKEFLPENGMAHMDFV